MKKTLNQTLFRLKKNCFDINFIFFF